MASRFDFICASCERPLEVECDEKFGNFKIQLCPDCIDEARKDAHQVGYDEGLKEAREEAERNKES